MEEEINVKKGATIKLDPSPDQFLSNIFTNSKKNGGNRPVINLNKLNNFIHCPHFKMEGLFLVRELLSPKDWMCKVDLKDAYFSIPIHKNSQRNLPFEWEGSLYQFLCLCFGLYSAPLAFTKLMKVPVALLRRLKVRLIIYPDNILMMAPSKEELEIGRDALVFLLKHLGFVINVKKSVLCPTVLPARFHYRYQLRQQTDELRTSSSYKKQIVLSPQSRAEIQWWVHNLKLNNEKSLIRKPSQLIIKPDASKGIWGAYCPGESTWGPWSEEDRNLHINVLELKEAKFVILAFTQETREQHPHSNGQHGCSFLSSKNGGTNNQDLVGLSKQI